MKGPGKGAKKRHRKGAGHILMSRSRSVGKIFFGHLDCGAIHPGSFKMCQRGHGQHCVTQLDGTRDDLIRLTVTPDQAHDLIDERGIPCPCNHDIYVLSHITLPGMRENWRFNSPAQAKFRVFLKLFKTVRRG